MEKTVNQRLNSKKPGNRVRPQNRKTAAFKCENRKTKSNIGQIWKTENSNAPLTMLFLNSKQSLRWASCSARLLVPGEGEAGRGGKNISDTLCYPSCATFLFLRHFDVDRQAEFQRMFLVKEVAKKMADFQ